jgi:hypothetical protein
MSKKPKIEYYESAETAPIRRWQKFNKYLGKKAETGDEPIDIFKRVDRIVGYAGAGDNQSVIKEASNLKMAWHQMLSEYNLEGMANAVMVKSINGVLKDDITTEGLEATLDELNKLGVSKNDIEAKNAEIKKKLLKLLKYTSLMLLVLVLLTIIWLGFNSLMQG